MACLALNSSKWFGSCKCSVENTSCFLTRETRLCVLVRGLACKAGGPGWVCEKLHNLCRRVILGKEGLSNRVRGIIYRSAEW